MLTHGAQDGQSNSGMQAMLTEFRSLIASTNQLSFYSFQRSWLHRPQLAPPAARPQVLAAAPGAGHFVGLGLLHPFGHQRLVL